MYSITDLLRSFIPKMFIELPSVSGPGENQIDKATAHGTTSRGGTDITHVRPVKIPITIAVCTWQESDHLLGEAKR